MGLVGACATLALIGSALVGVAAAASARTVSDARCASPAVTGPTRIGHLGGLVRPTTTHAARCSAGKVRGFELPYQGTPPLLFHHGQVMSTRATNDQVVVTPIFWAPSGFSFTASYENTITQYLHDLAAASGKLTNVFASLYQYHGTNGGINYRMQVAAPIVDTTAFPTSGCTVASNDTTNIYADNSGYTNCLDDDQINGEASNVVSAHGLTSDLGHMYIVFLPKHVESCFAAGATNTAANACTINNNPSAAFCAYHSIVPTSHLVYANMPFPIYLSANSAGFSCTNENLGSAGVVQSPNGDTDADVEISPLSHEMSEAITDPDVSTGWYDSTGNENGDDCAYIYGTLHGTSGTFFNQTINGHHYLTQEEFSNKDFVVNTSGCIPGIKAVKPSVSSLSPKKGSRHGGNHVTITGKGFPGASKVRFGTKSAHFTVLDATHIDAKVPAGTGKVDVTVSTSAGTSAKKTADRYTYIK